MQLTAVAKLGVDMARWLTRRGSGVKISGSGSDRVGRGDDRHFFRHNQLGTRAATAFASAPPGSPGRLSYRGGENRETVDGLV
jgi:hypothetical protein